MTAPNPVGGSATDAAPVQLDAGLVLAKVQQSGELGRALVRSASYEVLAEHHAAEATELRAQLAEQQSTGTPAPARGDITATP